MRAQRRKSLDHELHELDGLHECTLPSVIPAKARIHFRAMNYPNTNGANPRNAGRMTPLHKETPKDTSCHRGRRGLREILCFQETGTRMTRMRKARRIITNKKPNPSRFLCCRFPQSGAMNCAPTEGFRSLWSCSFRVWPSVSCSAIAQNHANKFAPTVACERGRRHSIVRMNSHLQCISYGRLASRPYKIRLQNTTQEL
jgi:hypothetical protein